MAKKGQFENYFAEISRRALTVVHEETDYIKAATCANTRQAYQSDIRDYQDKFAGPLPASSDDVVRYLKWSATRVNPNTIKRRLTSLRQWHRLQSYPDPTQDELIGKTMLGIARTHGKPKRKARALDLEGLASLVEYCDANPSRKNIRNKAALLVGYYGAFRCSELVIQTWEQIEFVREGVIIMLPRSKTDQIGEGRTCPIPFGSDRICPVRALMAWREESRCHTGPVYRRITKAGKILPQPISSRHWNAEFKELVLSAKLPMADQMSSHSLRRGSTTEAARRGASPQMLQRHGRWKSGVTVLEYIEEGRQFQDAAANMLFDFNN